MKLSKRLYEKKRIELNTYCSFINSSERLCDDLMRLSEIMQLPYLIERSDLDELRCSVIDLYDSLVSYSKYLTSLSLSLTEDLSYDNAKC